MFERDHHLRIATILQALDADKLMTLECLFGGGTAIVLSHGEYRESVDLDFLISSKTGFRELRQLLTGSDGITSIVRSGFRLNLARELRADQYGIRTMLEVGDVEIKFEIVFEGRISFEPSHSSDRICGVATLTQLDLAASKMLANSDRWSDDSVFNRDLIDLAMLDLSPKLLNDAIKKASSAYGDSVTKDLQKAIEKLRNRRGRLKECMTSLKIDSIPEALLWKKIKTLVSRS